MQVYILCSYDTSSHLYVFRCQDLTSECKLQLQHYLSEENTICFAMTHFALSDQECDVEKARFSLKS